MSDNPDDVLRNFAQQGITPEATAEALNHDQQAAGHAIHARCHEKQLTVKQAGALLRHMGSEAKAALMHETLRHLGAEMDTLAVDSADAKLLGETIKAGGNFDAEGVAMVREQLSQLPRGPFAGPISVIVVAVAESGRDLTEVLGGDAALSRAIRTRAQISFSSNIRPDAAEGHVGRFRQGGGGGGRFC